MADTTSDVATEENENLRPKRSLSVSSTDHTPSKRRRIGTRPTADPVDAEQKRKEKEELRMKRENEKVEAKRLKELEREEAKRQKELEKAKQIEEKEELRKQKELEREEAKRQKDLEKAKQLEEKEKAKKQKEQEKEEARLQKEQEKQQKELEREEAKRQKDLEKAKQLEEKLQKEREKQQKDEEQKALAKRQSAAFKNYFFKVKTEEPKKVGWSNELFMPFEIKANMKMAPLLHRDPLSKEAYDSVLLIQLEESDYLKKIFKQKCRRTTKDPLRAKYFHFHDNFRPPYYGTWRKVSKVINGRRPFSLSHKELNYEIDSDAEWEEERAEDGDDCLSEADNEAGKDESDESGDDEFYVDHGYLSENEGSENSSNGDDEDSSQRKRRLDHRAHEFKNQRTNKNRRQKKPLLTQTYGFTWDLDPNSSSYAIESRLMKAVIFDFPPTTKK